MTPAAPPPPRDPGPNRWEFAPPEAADELGLVGVGADLEPATLVDAYRRGIFPWPHEGWPLPWFSPDPRAVITTATLHLSRRFLRAPCIRFWTTTVDHAFPAVMDQCASRRAEGTWITPAMKEAYCALHEMGWAHSLEVWEEGVLVGGIYGVQVGGIFTAESMFYIRSGASKVALADLVLRFAESGGRAVDVQLPTPHLTSMGATAIPRASFLEMLAAERDRQVAIPVEARPLGRIRSELGSRLSGRQPAQGVASASGLSEDAVVR